MPDEDYHDIRDHFDISEEKMIWRYAERWVKPKR